MVLAKAGMAPTNALCSSEWRLFDENIRNSRPARALMESRPRRRRLRRSRGGRTEILNERVGVVLSTHRRPPRRPQIGVGRDCRSIGATTRRDADQAYSHPGNRENSGGKWNV